MDARQGSIGAAPEELSRSEPAGESDRPSTFALLRRIRLALSKPEASRRLDPAEVELLRAAAGLLRQIAASGETGGDRQVALGQEGRASAPRPEPEPAAPGQARRRRRRA